MTRDLDLSQTRDCLCLAARRHSRRITALYEAHFRGSGLKATQFTCFTILAQAGPLTVAALASTLGANRTTVTRLIEPLALRGLVDVRRGGTDARERFIGLTETGRAETARLLPLWQAAQAEASALPPSVSTLHPKGSR